MVAALALVLAQQIPRDTATHDTLPAISVSVTRTPGPLGRIPGAVSVVDAARLAAKPLLGVFDFAAGRRGR